MQHLQISQYEQDMLYFLKTSFKSYHGTSQQQWTAHLLFYWHINPFNWVGLQLYKNYFKSLFVVFKLPNAVKCSSEDKNNAWSCCVEPNNNVDDLLWIANENEFYRQSGFCAGTVWPQAPVQRGQGFVWRDQRKLTDLVI